MLVLWSGGCDSTMVLHDLLQTASPSKPVRSVGVNCPRMGGNSRNLDARKRIQKRLERDGYGRLHRHIEVEINDNDNFHHVAGLVQPAIWLIAAACCLIGDVDLYVGYVRGDDFGHYRSQFESIFNGLQAMSERTGKLVFPLEWAPKSDVLNALNSVGLIKLTWWCQNSGEKPCQICSSCLTHAEAWSRLNR